jgi:kynurenine formamidase
MVLDVAAEWGVAPIPDGAAVDVGHIEAALSRPGVTMQRGDAVLLRTGKAAEFGSDPVAAWQNCPGLTADAARWLVARGMAVLGIDSTSADALPMAGGDGLAHEALLLEAGVPIVENLYLEEIVAAGVTECCFVCLPLRIQGASGSWVRPVAIV